MSEASISPAFVTSNVASLSGMGRSHWLRRLHLLYLFSDELKHVLMFEASGAMSASIAMCFCTTLFACASMRTCFSVGIVVIDVFPYVPCNTPETGN